MTVLPRRGLAVAALALALAILPYLIIAAPGRSQASDVTVAISSATAAPNSQVTVNLLVTPQPGVSVGALLVVVNHDSGLPGLLLPVSCEALGPYLGDCNTGYDVNQVAFAWVDADPFGGISGSVGTLTFNTAATEGVAPLTLEIITCTDEVGTDLTCGATDGTITIVQPTPSPTATPAPTPTPTPMPTPTPTPSPPPRIWGDVNCDGAVTAVDALALLRDVAGLPVFQVAPCPTIGAVYPQPIPGK